MIISIFTYGLVFGVLARQAGMTSAETLLMSSVVFAGSAQFAAVAMLSAGTGSLQIIVAVLLLNLRHLLMGASLAPYLKDVGPWRLAVLAHGLNDESYAVTISRFQEQGGSVLYFLAVGLATFIGWIASTAVSVVAGSAIGDPRKYGLDFAFLGRGFRFIPIGIIIAIIVPGLLVLDGRINLSWNNFYLLAGLASAMAALRWRNMFASLAAGMSVMILLKSLGLG
ncbi:MAG: AzlC family ABC transporter permease [Peptococcaceae bacterium]|nr:AzlC family ABC transporter permease [Peptococcaceae bacterium]